MIHLILSLVVSQLAFASSKPLKLIQTGKHIQWMTESEADELSLAAHEDGHCGGYMDVTRFSDEYGVRFTDTQKNRTTDWVLKGREPKFPNQVAEVMKELNQDSLQQYVEKLSAFQNRYYKSDTGVESMNWIATQFQKVKNKNKRSDVLVEFFDHKDFKQPSVIATIAGKNPDLAQEIVVLGGHGDSINWSSADPKHARAPGADDNASGSATVLEVFRVLTESGFKPDRTIQFMIYAGEEKGLLGSQDIAEDAKKNKDNVVAVMQLDMTQFAGSGQKLHFVTDYVNADLTKFTQMLVDSYVKMPWTTMKCGYECSDHASWTAYGYASVFPFESTFSDSNPKIHKSGDIIDKDTDFEFGLQFAKLAAAFVVELSLEKGSKYRSRY